MLFLAGKRAENHIFISDLFITCNATKKILQIHKTKLCRKKLFMLRIL
jgi:hypothetical protein